MFVRCQKLIEWTNRKEAFYCPWENRSSYQWRIVCPLKGKRMIRPLDEARPHAIPILMNWIGGALLNLQFKFVRRTGGRHLETISNSANNRICLIIIIFIPAHAIPGDNEISHNLFQTKYNALSSPGCWLYSAFATTRRRVEILMAWNRRQHSYYTHCNGSPYRLQMRWAGVLLRE